MANNLTSNFGKIVLKKFMDGFMTNQVVSKTVNRDIFKGQFNPSSGDQVWVKRPHQYVTERTSNGDVTGTTKNQLTSGQAPATVQDYFTVRVEYDQVEEALELNQLPEILEPITQKMTDDNEAALVQFIIENASNFLGTAGTAVDAWSDVAQCFTFMDALGIKGGNQYAVMNPYSVQNLADAQTGLGVNPEVKTAWEKAMIPRDFGGGIALKSNNLEAHTVGKWAASTLTVKNASSESAYAAVKDTMTQTIVLTGATVSITGLLKAGDVLQFDTVELVNQQTKKQIFDASGTTKKFTATVTADADSDAGGDVTVSITAPIIVDATNPQYNNVAAAPAAGAAVTVVSGASEAVNQPNLFYHSNAFTLNTVQLPKLHSIDSAVLNNEGFSIRMHKYSDGDANSQMVRFDLLPAYGVLDPMKAGKFFGNP
jgi:hypothetical protein